MNRSYQQSFLHRSVLKSQATSSNSITELEDLRQSHNVADSTATNVLYSARKVRREADIPLQETKRDKITNITAQRSSISKPPLSESGTNTTVKKKAKSTGNILQYRIVDDDEWRRISTYKPQKSRQRGPRKTLSQTLSKTATILDGGKLSLVSSYITELDRIPPQIASRVRTLYLSHNSLESLAGAEQFINLTSVSVANNSIRFLDELSPLATLCHLEKLSLEGNPVTHMPYYRQLVIGLCGSSLNTLDGVRVTAEEASERRVHYNRAIVQMEQMRCSGLRMAVLEHMYGLIRCHAEIVRTVVGRFRSMLGMHMDANSGSCEAGRGASYVSSVLRFALAGGVFRWLQISAGRDFERRAQDLAYRMYISVTRKMTDTQRNKLKTEPSQQAHLWDRLTSDCLQRQQQACMTLVHLCETSHETLSLSSSGGSALRRSKEFESATGLLRLSVEKENILYPQDGHGSADVVHALQQLQFEGSPPVVRHSDGESSRHAWEVQVTYCGTGPHYRLPMADVLSSQDVHARKEHVKEMQLREVEAQRRELQLREERTIMAMAAERDVDRVGGGYVYGIGIDESDDNNAQEEVKQQYMRLLKQGLSKQAHGGRGRGRGRVNAHQNTEKMRNVDRNKAVSPERRLSPERALRNTITNPFDNSKQKKVSPDRSPKSPESRHFDNHNYVLETEELRPISTSDRKPSHHTEAASPATDAPIAPMSREDIILSMLYSPEVESFMSSPTEKNGFNPPSSEWAESLFTDDALGLSSEVLFAANENSPSGPPSQIIGVPPVPWSRPNTSTQSAPSMRSLNRLFESGMSDAEKIHRDTRTIWSCRVNLLKNIDRAVESMRLSSSRGVSELQTLLSDVDKQRTKNMQVQREWIGPVDELLGAIEERRSEICRLKERVQVVEASIEEINEDIVLSEKRKEDLMCGAAEVTDAVMGMRDEMETSASVREAIRFHHISTLASDFLHSTETLRSFRREALRTLRRRVLRQKKIRRFYEAACALRRREVLRVCMNRIESAAQYEGRCRKAGKWIRINRTGRMLHLWAEQYMHSRTVRKYLLQRDRCNLRTAVRFWWNLVRKKGKLNNLLRAQNRRILWFRMKWILFYWRQLASRSPRLLTQHGEVTDPYQLDYIARKHFKHTLLIAWIRLTATSKRDLKDRLTVLNHLHCARLVDSGFSLWRMLFLSYRRYRISSYRRGLGKLCRVAKIKKVCRWAIRRAVDFYSFKRVIYAMRMLMHHSQCNIKLRRRFESVYKLRLQNLIARSLQSWETLARERGHEKENNTKAMVLYIYHMMRGTWRAWLAWCADSREVKRVRRALAAQEVENERLRELHYSHCPRATRKIVHSTASIRPSFADTDIDRSDVSLNPRQGVDLLSDDEGSYSDEYSDSICTSEEAAPLWTRCTRHRYSKESRMSSRRRGIHTFNPLPHLRIRYIKIRYCLMRWFIVARRQKRLDIAHKLTQRRNCRFLLRSYMNIMVQCLAKRCLVRLKDALSLQDGKLDFEERAENVKQEVIKIRSELNSAREALDSERAALAEKQSQAEVLESSLSVNSERLAMARTEIDNMVLKEKETRDMINAILITCSGTSATERGENALISDTYRRVLGMSRGRIREEETEKSQPLSREVEGKGMERPLAAEIDAYVESKIALMADVEKEYRAAITASKEKHMEKKKLQDSVNQAFSLARHCKEVLLRLAKEAEELNEQKNAAENTLRDCEKALDSAVDRIRNKAELEEMELTDLAEEKKELLSRTAAAEQEENMLRSVLEDLRRSEALEDRHTMETIPAVELSTHDVEAIKSRATAQAATIQANKSLQTAQLRSSAALIDVVDGHDARSDISLLRPDLPPSPPLPDFSASSSEDTRGVTRRSLDTQHSLMNLSDNRALYRVHTASVPVCERTALKQSVSSTVGCDSETRESHSNDSDSISSRNDGLHQQIESLSSRIRSRLLTPPAI